MPSSPDIFKELMDAAMRGDPEAKQRLLDDLRADRVANPGDGFADVTPTVPTSCISLSSAHACPSCGAHAPFLPVDWHIADGPASPGAAIELDLDRLDPDSDWLLRRPPPGGAILALAPYHCPNDHQVWCAITIRDGRLAEIAVVTLDRALLRRAHVINAGGAQLAAARLERVNPWVLTSPRAILSVLVDKLP